MQTDDIWSQEIDRLTEHAGFGFDSAHTPADDAEAVDHGGMRISADERVRIINALFFEHALGEVFEVDLVNDADARRHDFEAVESLRAPFEKLIALAIALEFHLHVQAECIGRSGEIDLDGVIDNQIDRDQWLDNFWIFAEPGGCRTHGSQINQQWDAGEILKDDARDDKRDFFSARGFGLPIRESANVCFSDLLLVAIAEDRFEDDTNGDRKTRDSSETRFLKGRERVKLALLAIAEIEVPQRSEKVVLHSHFLIQSKPSLSR